MAQKIIVDTTPGFMMPTIYYSQGDIGRTFEIDLRSRFGDALPASPTITIRATKPSGLGFSVAATSISGTVATFTVTDTMSNEAGRFLAEIKVVKNSVTLFTANFYVECEASAHPEGTTDGDLDNILPKYVSVTTTTLPAGSSATYSYDPATNTATFGIPKGADGSLASAILAPTYSSSSTYAVGDYVYYNGNLYICSTAITTAESWTSGHWTQVTVSGELSDLKDDINAKVSLDTAIAKGATATFNNTIGRAPIKNIIANIDYIQSGSGDPTPTNARAISGNTGLSLNHSDDDTSDPTIVSISWNTEAGTVYSGTLNITTGVLTVDKMLITAIKSQVNRNNANNWYINTPSAYKPLIKHDTDIPCISNKFKPWEIGTSQYTATYQCFVTTAGYIRFNTEVGYNDVDSMYAAVGEMTFLCDLVSPQTYHISANDIYALIGENNIWTNVGDVSVEYYIDKVSISADDVNYFKSETYSDDTVGKELQSITDTLDDKYSAMTGTTQSGKYIRGSDGTVQDITGVGWAVDSFTVQEGMPYIITARSYSGNYYYAFYNSNNDFISGAKATETGTTGIDSVMVTAPANAVKLCVCSNTGNQSALGQDGYEIPKKWADKKWVVFGDSLTEVNVRTTKHYFDYISEKTGISTYNMGNGGSGYASEYDISTAFPQRIGDVPTDADVITVFGSFNDLSEIGTTVTLGTATDSGTSTIGGLINLTLDNLFTAFPLANVGLVTPTPWVYANPTTEPNTASEYCQLIVDVCKRRGIPCLDLFHCSQLRPWESSYRDLCYSKDEGNGVHPDETGHKVIAPRFEGFLNSLLLG